VFVCSVDDRALLAERVRDPHAIVVAPNAVAVPRLPPPRPAGRRALFVGFVGYGPNRDAAQLLCETIWPRVRAGVADAHQFIAGGKPEEVAAAQMPPPGVAFGGFVPDLEGCYAEADLFCCPILAGGGTRVKLIEAAMHARPIVSTAVGAEGLGFVDGVHALIRDERESFADACVELLRNPARAATLGANARELTIERYSRPRVVDLVAREFEP
jgi:glycosyltransferase involved in cell wall biosynthesis